jgi:flagellar motor switch protein FliN/FliY
MSATQEEVMSDPSDDWAAALAEQATATATETVDTDALFDQPSAAKPAKGLFQPFSGSTASNTPNDIDMVLDIPVQLTVELGRTKIPIKHILQLAQGSVIELDGMAGEPMDVLVNGYLIAQGEVVVVNDKFGIRLTDIITPSERLRKLNR